MDRSEWLLTEEGRRLLAEAAAAEGPLLSRVAGLRKRWPTDAVAAAVEMAELRRRGRAKFDAAADRMYFTAAGLEMATSPAVAAHKAARFAGAGRVGDLCCGIGGDLIGLAATAGGPVAALDSEPRHAAFARENAAVHGLADRVDVRIGDVTASLPAFDAVHIDPDWRRPSGRRNRKPDLFRPPADVLARLAAAHAGAAVKLPSAADFDSLGWDGEIEVISERRECKQAVCWFGAMKRARRTATMLPSGRTLCERDGESPAPPPTVRPVGRYVFEPDPAVIRAGLIARLAAEADLAVLDPRIAYLTADRPLDDPAVVGFEVMDVFPWSLRRARDLLRVRGVGRVEVKKRGVAFDTDELARELRRDGSAGGQAEEATVIITRIGERPVGILCRRLDAAARTVTGPQT